MTVLVFPTLLLLAAAGVRPEAAPVKPAAPSSVAAVSKALTACVASRQGDIEEALGALVSRIQEENGEGESSCDYLAGAGKVTVTVIRSRTRLDVSKEIEALRNAFPQARMRDLDGLGVRAFFLEMAGAGAQLHVIRAGGYEYLMVSVLGLGEPAHVASAAEKIARKAASRL